MKGVNKPHNTKTIDAAVHIVRNSGKQFIPNIILGLPGETVNTYQKTMDFLTVNSDVISHANIYNLAIYEDTELSKEVEIGADSDRIETTLEKTFHTNPAVHAAAGRKMVKLLNKLIN